MMICILYSTLSFLAGGTFGALGLALAKISKDEPETVPEVWKAEGPHVHRDTPGFEATIEIHGKDSKWLAGFTARALNVATFHYKEDQD